MNKEETMRLKNKGLLYPWALDEKLNRVWASELDEHAKNKVYKAPLLNEKGEIELVDVCPRFCKNKRNHYIIHPKYGLSGRKLSVPREYYETVSHELFREAIKTVVRIKLPKLEARANSLYEFLWDEKYIEIKQIDVEQTYGNKEFGFVRYDFIITDDKGRKYGLEFRYKHPVDYAKSIKLDKVGIDTIEIFFPKLVLDSKDDLPKLIEALESGNYITRWVSNKYQSLIENYQIFNESSIAARTSLFNHEPGGPRDGNRSIIFRNENLDKLIMCPFKGGGSGYIGCDTMCSKCERKCKLEFDDYTEEDWKKDKGKTKGKMLCNQAALLKKEFIELVEKLNAGELPDITKYIELLKKNESLYYNLISIDNISKKLKEI